MRVASSWSLSAWLSVCCLTLASMASPALAHPDVDEGKRLAKQLELEPALLAYQRALDSGTLSYDELVELLVERVLILHGLKRQAERDADLRWLLAVAPTYELDVRAPPDLDARHRAMRSESKGPLNVKLKVQVSGSVEAQARLTGNVPEGAHARIFVREKGKAWRREESSTLWQVAIPGADMELYAEAVALGGVAVASDHTDKQPYRVRVPAAGESPTPIAVAPLGPALPRTDESEQPSWARRHRGLLIAGGIVVVAAAAVTAALLLKPEQEQGSSTTVKPMVSF